MPLRLQAKRRMPLAMRLLARRMPLVTRLPTLLPVRPTLLPMPLLLVPTLPLLVPKPCRKAPRLCRKLRSSQTSLLPAVFPPATSPCDTKGLDHCDPALFVFGHPFTPSAGVIRSIFINCV
jgi:hypothetical protein